MRLDAAIESGWMNEAEEALQRIKRKLNKLQTLAIPKEGEELMLCLQGEQVQKTPQANKGETSNLSKNLQEKLTPTLRPWRLYLGKEAIKEGSGVGIILVSLDEKMHSYAIRLKFNASDHAMDYEALLARLVASVSKDVLTGLATIKLEFLNQEVLVGIKTRPSVKVERAVPKGEAIRLKTGGMTQDLLDGQPHIYSQFALISEQQVFSSIPRAPPLTENGLTKKGWRRKERKN
ncbi:hypothetical protein Tco_0681165 [Tanacetum coccineum]|uniref:Uncharacterized protein n=1 Tax=Tanacetum coccineum TaxID=301880 RepID=A0ABQ4XP50_9ASTR